MLNCWIIRMTAVLAVICPAFSKAHFSLWNKQSCKSGCKGIITLQIERRTTVDGTASIYCPDLKNEEEHFSLHKEKTELHSADFNMTQALNSSEPRQRLHVYIENNTVHYLIRMIQVNDTGLYCCGVSHDRTAYTLLLVKESLQSCLSEGRPLSWLMLAAGCGLLTLYNLIVTTVACYFGRKLKNGETETQSDYYNTRPGEFKRVR